LHFKIKSINFVIQSTFIYSIILNKTKIMTTINLKLPIPTYRKAALIGGAIGLIIISLFLIGCGGGKAEWSRWWMLRPLLIVPLATATGGLVFMFLNRIAVMSVWARAALTIFGGLIFIISLWFGSVLGLAGYYWH
jgi:hypothetical protein